MPITIEERRLKRAARREKQRQGNIGRGAFYPAELPSSGWFKHYAGRFKTVELNAPFYSWPTVATVNSRIRQAGRREFHYMVKVCELITHVKRFAGTNQLVQDFGLLADLLGPRMGCFLFQLPPSFHYTPARLEGPGPA